MASALSAASCCGLLGELSARNSGMRPASCEDEVDKVDAVHLEARHSLRDGPPSQRCLPAPLGKLGTEGRHVPESHHCEEDPPREPLGHHTCRSTVRHPGKGESVLLDVASLAEAPSTPRGSTPRSDHWQNATAWTVATGDRGTAAGGTRSQPSGFERWIGDVGR